MKLDNTFLDLNSATIAKNGRAMIGWRRRIEVRKDSVVISELASPDKAGVDIGIPPTEFTIRCKPKPASVDPINRSGWLALDMLEPGHTYWLELRAYEYTSIEREDGARDSVWHWKISSGAWGGSLCE